MSAASRSDDHQEVAELQALLIDSVVDYAMFVLDADGVVRSWNPGAERLKGYRADEIIGHRFSIFYTPEDRESGLPHRLLGRARDEGRVTHTGWRVRKDGTRFWGDVTITALRGADGEIRGFAKVTRDRTDQHEAEVAMADSLEREQAAVKELEAMHRARARFLSAISHDLRTPLGVIRGTLPMLRQGAGDDPDEEEMLDVVDRNVERLHVMTSQLSELSRLERGMLELDRQPVDLADAVAACLRSLGPILDAFEVVTDVEGQVQLDPLAFERVLTNLLTNAARHAPTGSTITVSSRRQDGEVIIRVEDEGAGVAVDERDTIFHEFRQGRSRRPGEGLGLGLSIVRHYAEAHGGRAWVESGDVGARFCLAFSDQEA